MRATFKIVSLVLCLCAVASADPFRGTVYGVYPEGVMINSGAGAYLVPTQQATFEVGGVRATWTNLQPGQVVTAIMPDPYLRDVITIPDPYQWKMRHHPNHPHGGPPGQMKKGHGHPGKVHGRGGGGKGRGR